MSIKVAKIFKAIKEYRSFLARNQKESGNKSTLRGLKSKNKILDFYIKNGCWPKRNSTNKIEKQLGIRIENFIAPTAPAFDKHFRNIVMMSGRKSNNKRKHDIKKFKQEILEFIEKHGRVPTTYSGEVVAGEGTLRAKLDYYTKEKNDMTFLSKVYAGDKCHRSGILHKFRPVINESLRGNKPLIRII